MAAALTVVPEQILLPSGILDPNLDLPIVLGKAKSVIETMDIWGLRRYRIHDHRESGVKVTDTSPTEVMEDDHTMSLA